MKSLLPDLRHAVRLWRKSPVFTLVAVLSMAIGIGANTTIFSTINAVFLRRPPYPNAGRLVTIVNVPHKQPGVRETVSTADVAHWRENNRFFDRIEATAWGVQANALSGAGVPERVSLQYFTPGVFPLLGIRPVLGSVATEQEMMKQGSSTVTISYEFWQRHFGGNPRVIGRSVVVDNNPVIVSAVLPRGFDLFGGAPPDIVMLTSVDATGPFASDRWFMGLARLKPGIPIGQAQAAMDVLARQMEKTYPATNKGLGVKLQPLQDGLFGWSREILYPLFAAVAFVLLIACTNIANLLLSRASTRRKEIGIRAALGAQRSRLIRQLLTESILLSLTGGLLGLLLSIWGIKVFVALAPSWLPETTAIRIDARVLAFTIAISLLTGILFGLAPALRASKTDLNDSLKEGGRGSAAGLRQHTRSTLVVVEVALALVLLASAGLMINTVTRVLRANPGFHSNHLVTLEVRLTGKKYITSDGQLEKTGLDLITPQVGIFCRAALERIRAIPGVESAVLTDWLPMIESAERIEAGFRIAGQANASHSEQNSALLSAVSPDYFHVMQIPLRKGRQLTGKEVEAAPWVVVINDAMAKKYWGDRNPIGQIVTVDTLAPPGEERPREIVGVVGDVRQFRLGKNASPEIYAPYPQQARHAPSSATETRLHKSLVLRTRSGSPALIKSIQKAVEELDKDSPVFGIKTVRQIVNESTNLERFYTQLLGVFAAVALLLAAIGIYGVISYTVTERNHELGLRIALGAQPGQVLRLVLRQGLTLSVLGVALGLAASLGATPLLSNFLYGVRPHDPLTLLSVSFFLIGITVLATYVPAHRATKVDPMVTLRHE